MVMTCETPTNPLLTTEEAAKMLGISQYSVYRWCKRGWLASIKLPNGTIRIERASLDNALAGR